MEYTPPASIGIDTASIGIDATADIDDIRDAREFAMNPSANRGRDHKGRLTPEGSRSSNASPPSFVESLTTVTKVNSFAVRGDSETLTGGRL